MSRKEITAILALLVVPTLVACSVIMDKKPRPRDGAGDTAEEDDGIVDGVEDIPGEVDAADEGDAAGDPDVLLDPETPEDADAADGVDLDDLEDAPDGEEIEVPPTCGNGEMEDGEECDDGADGDPDDGCTDDCRYSCHFDEECDDGLACTDDRCDTTDTHTCSNPPATGGTICRSTAGLCDIAEACDGTSNVCPDDGFMSDSTVCRSAVDACDVRERCTGDSGLCPADAFMPSGTECDDGAYCTIDDQCDGSGGCAGTAAPGLHGVVAISSGNDYACALLSSGGVKCWGQNNLGQLGDGSTRSSNRPVDVTSLASGVDAIAAGSIHTCAIMDTGTMKCWGNNDYGTLGNGTTTDSLVPVDVTGLAAAAVSAELGNNHSCAILDTGEVQCWGDNSYGQLGDGTTVRRNSPVYVGGLSSGAIGISAGSNHTCAVMDPGGVMCWGRNNVGQLGDGTNDDQHAPVDVSDISTGASQVSAGALHSCAVVSSGARCWGYNFSGQLGNGTTVDSNVPVDVSGLASGVAQVSAGMYALYNHSCALLSDGSVMCWGENISGKLGNGTLTDSLVPVAVIDLASDAVAVSLGTNFSSALLDTGLIMSWGSNNEGQLGVDPLFPNYSSRPVTVLCE